MTNRPKQAHSPIHNQSTAFTSGLNALLAYHSCSQALNKRHIMLKPSPTAPMQQINKALFDNIHKEIAAIKTARNEVNYSCNDSAHYISDLIEHDSLDTPFLAALSSLASNLF